MENKMWGEKQRGKSMFYLSGKLILSYHKQIAKVSLGMFFYLCLCASKVYVNSIPQETSITYI